MILPQSTAKTTKNGEVSLQPSSTRILFEGPIIVDAHGRTSSAAIHIYKCSLSLYIYVCVYMYMRMGHLPIIYIHLPLFLVPMFLNSDRPVTRSGSSWFSLASSSNASAQNHWQPLIHKIHIQRCVVGGIGQLLNLLNKANYWDIRISPHEKPMLKTGKPWKTSINSY